MSGLAVGTPFLIGEALSAGVDLAVGLYNIHKSKKEAKQIAALRSSVECNCKHTLTTLNAAIDALGADFRKQVSDELAKLASLKTAIVESPSMKEFQDNAMAFGDGNLRLRKTIELFKIEQNEIKLAPKLDTIKLPPTPDTSQFFNRDVKKDVYVSVQDKEREALLSDSAVYGALIENIDKEAYAGVAHLINEARANPELQRLRIIRDSIKLQYGRLKEDAALSIVYKTHLRELSAKLASYDMARPVMENLARLSENKYVRLDEYNAARKEAFDALLHEENKRARHQAATHIASTLDALGYTVITGEASPQDALTAFEAGAVTYLKTQWDNYRVMLKYNEDGSVAARLVRVVASDKEKPNPSAYQKQKDTETARKWCGDFDRFLNELKDKGIGFNVELRKEPDEEDILAITDASIAEASHKVTKQTNTLRAV